MIINGYYQHDNLEHLFDNYYFNSEYSDTHKKIEVNLIVKSKPTWFTPSGEYNVESVRYRFFPSKEKSRKKAMKLALAYDKKEKREKRIQEKLLQ